MCSSDPQLNTGSYNSKRYMKYLKEVKNDSHTFIGEFLESEFDDYNLNFSLKAKYKTFFIKVFGIFILIKLNFSANMIFKNT